LLNKQSFLSSVRDWAQARGCECVLTFVALVEYFVLSVSAFQQHPFFPDNVKECLQRKIVPLKRVGSDQCLYSLPFAAATAYVGTFFGICPT
jgi:hypothetical protein